MGFFDLNIPYLEGSAGKSAASVRDGRLKLCVKAMELGYAGVAYNRSIKGVMSDADRCSIPPFSLPTILNSSPSPCSLVAAVKLHRDLLGVPAASPFRQYRRLTVFVESAAQASALNSGNPILRTYDLVAVRPLNQNAYEQACLASEVDIIAIDFSERLPFRLKLPMIKAAIERGVHFEITYSGLLANAQTRRQVISNAKLLVEWTRGKNLIFSSAVPSVSELRGPCDVSNLLSLFGLSAERAKAAISKNCRSLIANALRKKHYFKEAIRVEVIPSREQSNSKESFLGELPDWDPISSGEGDLQLDDMAKIFSATCKVSQNLKAIDFTSNSDRRHHFHVDELTSRTLVTSQPLETGNVSEDSLVETHRVPEKPDQLDWQSNKDLTSLPSTSSNVFTVGCETDNKFFPPTNYPKDISSSEELRTSPAAKAEGLKIYDGFNVHVGPIGEELNDLQCNSNSVIQEDMVETPTMPNDMEVDGEVVLTDHLMEGNLLGAQDNKFKKTEHDPQNVTMAEVLTDGENVKQSDSHMVSVMNVPLLQNHLGRCQSMNTGHDQVLPTDGALYAGFHDEMKSSKDSSISKQEKMQELPNANVSQESSQEVLHRNQEITQEVPRVNEELMQEVPNAIQVSTKEAPNANLESENQAPNVSQESTKGVANACRVSKHVAFNAATISLTPTPTLDQYSSGKVKLKRRATQHPILFPFKRLLNSVPPRKKARTLKSI